MYSFVSLLARAEQGQEATIRLSSYGGGQYYKEVKSTNEPMKERLP